MIKLYLRLLCLKIKSWLFNAKFYELDKALIKAEINQLRKNKKNKKREK